MCGILVDVTGDEVVRVRGDQDHPLSHGYTCAKGRALPQMHHHPDRIERPQVRVDGELRDTTWEACLDDLGRRVREIIEQRARAVETVGVFFGSGNGMDAAGYRMSQALHAAIGTPAKFSPLAVDGNRQGAGCRIWFRVKGAVALSGRPDYDRATFVMFVGSNRWCRTATRSRYPIPVGRPGARQSGRPVWVVEPRD